MFTKAVLLSAIIGAVVAEHAFSSQHFHKYDGHHEPMHHGHGHGYEDHDYYTHPKYEFEYMVKDPYSHDYKSQHENRDGDAVKGYYELHDHDGPRHVYYQADKHSGFHSTVTHSTHHIVPEHHNQYIHW